MKIALYADDLVMWCTDQSAAIATYRLQQAVDKLHAWTEDWGVKINKEKSSITLFTLSTVKRPGTVTLGQTPLKEENEVTYLGVTFDKRHTWRPHLEKAETRARLKLAMLRKLAGSNWGSNNRVLRTVYQGSIRPVLEYGSTAWSTSKKTNLKLLDNVQNQALRIITGSMRSTHTQQLEKHAKVQPLSQRRELSNQLQADKFCSLRKHPMKKKLEGLTKNRLKRGSFVHEHKKSFKKDRDLPPPRRSDGAAP